MTKEDIVIGDIIRDVEDTDFYYEGIVVGLNPIRYIITNCFVGEDDSSKNGEITESYWWFFEVLRNGEFIHVD